MLKRDRLAYEFLPSALEIAETPPRPLAGVVLWTIVILIVTATVWSWLGRVDEVAVANGKTTPEASAKNIQAVQAGTIVEIGVKEGQTVKKGDVILKLDAGLLTRSLATAEQSLEYARVERDAYSAVVRGGDGAAIVMDSTLSDDQKSTLAQSIKDKVAAMRAKNQVLSATVNQYKSQLLTEESKTGLRNTLFQDQETAHQEKLTQLRSSLDIANANVGSAEAEMRANVSSLAAQSDAKIGQLQEAVDKLRQAIADMTITSPVDGKVQQLTTKTLGGVVTPAQLVASVIPDGSKLIAEVSILNKDRGFVSVGQEVAIKVDTFPFQRYGKLQGKLISISPDAVNDDKQGLVYRAVVEFEKTDMNIDGKKVSLIPGMSINAEIKTGERRILSFLLEPLVKYLDESIKIR